MNEKKLQKLTEETIKIIEGGGKIVLKRADGWYLHMHTNIAAGPDHAVWGREEAALEMFNLHWAKTIKKLYKCKVEVIYPPKHKHHHTDETGICMGGHTCARQALK